MSEPLLQVEDLKIEFRTSRGTLQALSGISFDVLPGEVFGLVGETGCGKTVTGLGVLRLVPKPGKITAGRILLRGDDLLAKSDREMQQIRGGQIAMIFQDPASSLNPVFTLGSQIARVIRQHQNVTAREANRQVVATLEAVGLPDAERLMDSYPHELSGGMQQRAMIAMALACQPALLIADEPTTALDVTIKAQILTLLRELQARFNLALLLITHDLGVVAEMCDRLAVLYAGHIAETGTLADIFSASQHPYTRGLMSAIPRRDSRGKPLTAIRGAVPHNPGTLVGCPFESRCDFAFDHCRAERPPLMRVEKNHLSACWLLQPDGGAR
ncbi:MAG: ABC transporter ATP-binding protein [Chloroflexota bacterium]